MKAIDKLYVFITTIVIISLCCSLIYGWFPIFNRTWIFVLAISILSILLYSNALKLKFILPLFFYGLVIYINMISGDAIFNFIFSTMELFCFIFASVVFHIYSKESFYKARQNLLVTYIIVIVVTFIGTFIVYRQDPNVIRMIQTEMNVGDSTSFMFFAKMGVESYAMGHALPCLIPILVYSIKKSNIKFRLLSILLLSFIIMLVYMSTATTALLLSIPLFIISILLNEKSKVKNIFVMAICICIAVIFITNRNILNNVLSNISLDSEIVYAGKLNDFQDYASYDKAGNQTQGRLNLYYESLESFISSPIVGIDSGKIGGHSIFLDRLALLGLLGFIPLIMYLYMYMRYVLNKLSKVVKPYCILGFSSFIIMGFLKNIFGFEYICICLMIMPIACLVIDNKAHCNLIK